VPSAQATYMEDDFLEFSGGDRRKEGLVSGTWRNHHQFQNLELPKVGDHRCSSSLNVGWSGKDVVLMRIAGKDYSHGSLPANLRVLAVVTLN